MVRRRASGIFRSMGLAGRRKFRQVSRRSVEPQSGAAHPVLLQTLQQNLRVGDNGGCVQWTEAMELAENDA